MTKKAGKFSWPVKSGVLPDHWFARLNEAIVEITIMHEGQRRKEANVPYIVHIFSVGNMLSTMGFPDYVIIAGLFHDGLEDTNMNFRINSWRYGVEALALVQVVTEAPKSIPWKKRKEEMLSRLVDAVPEAKVISACDKLDNLLSIQRALRAEGIRAGADCSKANVWKSFHEGYKKQKWYFQNITKALVANLPDTRNLPVVFGKLIRLVEDIFGESFLPPETRKLFDEGLKPRCKE